MTPPRLGATENTGAEPAIRLGEILVEQGLLTELQRDQVVAAQNASGQPFGLLAEQMFGICPSQVELAWTKQYGRLAERIDPSRAAVDAGVIGLIERRQAWQFGVLPCRMEAGLLGGPELVVATSERFLTRAMRFVGWRIAGATRFALCDEAALADALEAHYPLPGAREMLLAG